MSPLLDQFGRPVPARKLRPETKVLYTPDQRDRWAVYPSRGLTPGKLGAILREADQGWVARQVELFREVEEKDAHVQAEFAKRKAAVLSLKYEIHPASEDAQAEKAAEFCREALSGLEDLDDLLEDLMDAVAQGWAMNELDWEVSGGKALITGHRRIPQERTRWDQDTWEVRLATKDEFTKGVVIPPFKVVYHHHKGRAAIAPRAGVMRTVVWWWMFKNFSVKDWIAFLDCFGIPLRVGKYPIGTTEEDKDAFKAALYSLGTDGAALLSAGSDIEFVESKASGGSQLVFERMAAYCDKAISKATVGQTLTADVGSVGSLAAAKVHNDVREDIRDKDAWSLSKTMRRQVLRPLCIYNLGPDAPVPYFRFAVQAPEDLKVKAETYRAVLDMGAPIGLDHVYKAFDIPEPEPGDEVLTGQAAPGGADSGPQAEANSLVSIANRAPAISPAQQAAGSLAGSALAQAAPAATDTAGAILEALGRATDWDQAMRLVLASYRSLGTPALANPLYAAALAAELNGWLSAGNAPAPIQAKAQAPAGRRWLGGPRGLVQAANTALAKFLMEPLPPEAAIDFFAKKLPLTPEQFRKLSESAKSMAFAVAGVAEEEMLAGMFQAIGGAITDGTTLPEFQRGATELFQRAGFTGPNPYHLETIFRNQVQSAYMAGRYKQMASVATMRPFWQYSAVMDGGTRPEHAAQHGKVYRADDPYWGKWYPPNGHRCRCDVISLSDDEMGLRGLKAETIPPAHDPDPGWGHNVGVSGWGRGMVEAAFGRKGKSGGWRQMEGLGVISDSVPPNPLAPPPAKLPPSPDDLLRSLGSEDAVRRHYHEHFVQANGLELDKAGKALDLALTDVAGDPAIIAARMAEKLLGPEYSLHRGRYLGLAKEVVQEADRVWLVPGEYPDGRITFRRRYVKFYGGQNSETGAMVMAEFEGRAWDGFNILQMRHGQSRAKQKGLLLFARSNP